MTDATKVFEQLKQTVVASRDLTLLGAAIARIVELENEKGMGAPSTAPSATGTD